MIQELWNGDCLKLMDNIETGTIDAVICDPPYGTTLNDWDKCLDFNILFNQYHRICKKNAPIILFGSGLFTVKLISSSYKDYKYSLVWKKSKCGSPLLAKYRPMIKHEDVIVFSNGGGRHTVFNPQTSVGLPYKRSCTRTKTNNHKFGITEVSTNNTGYRYNDSILDFPQNWRRQDQVHPTQKPIELLEYIITMYTNENNLVLDNCMGSGTTCIAAKKLNRQFIGIEQDINYYNLAKSLI